MAINPANVFLVAGQSMKSVAGQSRLSPEIEHHVVMALQTSDAYDFLASRKPMFKILGSSTLADHQAAIAKIESAFRGDDGDVEVHFTPSMSASVAD
jgi:hypothetical protein